MTGYHFGRLKKPAVWQTVKRRSELQVAGTSWLDHDGLEAYAPGGEKTVCAPLFSFIARLSANKANTPVGRSIPNNEFNRGSSGNQKTEYLHSL